MGELTVTRQLFMWCMSSIYLFAFASLYIQVPGLYGPNGITPVHTLLNKDHDHDTSSSSVVWLNRFKQLPSLIIFHSSIGLSPSVAMELCCVVGVIISFLTLIFRCMRCSVVYAILWTLYLSLFKTGQIFIWFQWDTLLLEAGFILIIVAPLNSLQRKRSSTDGWTLWLVKWLLFRLMLASGVVKLTSQCPTWWDLTALNHHYQTQCIPTPLAWYAHQLPDWVQRLSVVGTYFIEICTPMLFFMPVRSLRILAFMSQVFLQVLIIVTGNYNFFNLLTITLCFSLVDDRFLGYSSATKSNRILGYFFPRFGLLLSSAVSVCLFLTMGGLAFTLTVYYFNITIDTNQMVILSNIVFSHDGFDGALNIIVPLFGIIAALSLATEILSSVIDALLECGIFNKVFALFKVVVVSFMMTAMFSISLVSYGELDGQFMSTLPSSLKTLHHHVNDYSITNSYGLFRKMTGVGGRPEVIIEGTNGDPEGSSWKEYEFIYKPGNTRTSPKFVAPHQPRLDWQMWFAALGSYKNNPWLVHLVYKLLIGEEDVLQLMATPPFPTPPKYIRARLYHYQYTSYDTNTTIFDQTKVWWKRDLKSDYLYVLTKDNVQLQEYLDSYQYLTPVVNSSLLHSPLWDVLSLLREYSSKLSPPILLWSLFFTSFILSLPTLFTGRDDDNQNYKLNTTNYGKSMVISDSPRVKRGAYRRHASNSKGIRK